MEKQPPDPAAILHADFRAQVARSSEERAALKGVQHVLERALATHGMGADFQRGGDDQSINTRSKNGGYRNPL